MAILNNDKHKEYARFAAHCLEMVTSTRDQEVRRVQREMRQTNLSSADAIERPVGQQPQQIQPKEPDGDGK
jgi:hypothetical protein